MTAVPAKVQVEPGLTAIIDAAFEAVIVTDADGLIADWNARAEELFGWPRADAVGHSISDLIVSQAHQESCAEQLPPQSANNSLVECVAQRRDGSPVPIELTIYAIASERGPGHVLFARDISERRRAEHLLRHLTAHASSATGENFLRSAVLELSDLLGTAYAFIGEVIEGGARVRTIAVVADGKLVENFEYHLAHTPCHEVLRQSTCWYPRDVQRLFPKDALLTQMNVESYLGTPLKGASGAVSGILVVLHREPMRDELGSRWALEIFAARAAAELEHQRAEASLRGSEKRYRELVENSLGIICTHDLAGNFLTVNPEAMRFLGYEPHEYRGKTLHDMLAPEVRDQLGEYLTRIQRDGIASGLMRVVTKTGEERIWAYRNVLCEDADGWEYVLAHGQDVTELKHVEEQLRRSEAKYRSLVEHATHGIYRSSREGRFVAVNPALVKMLGYDSEEELLAVDMTQDLYVDAREREQLVEQYRESGSVADVEVDWRRKDGERIRVRLTGRALFDDQGNLDGFEMLAEDVTAHRALEGQLRQSQKMEAVGQLTGGIAHDFNNILTAVLSNAELIASELSPGLGDLRKDVDEIRTAARRGAQLVKKLMAFSRRERLVFEDLDLPHVCHEMTGMLQRLLPEHIDLQFVPEETGLVRADRGALEQILVNLATNARDAMPVGGTLRIAVRRAWVDQGFRNVHGWGDPGEYVCLIVSDTGVGMDERTRRRIFEPFFTTKPSGEGTGLGMAMVYGLVKQHNGFVSVYSELENGTTVRVYLPCAAPAHQEAEVGREAKAERGGTETILLAEDDDAIRRSAQRILERWGYRVRLVADGEEALQTLRLEPGKIDLVVADLIMPKIGGQRLWEEAKAEGLGVPFLFTSGYTARDLKACGDLEPGVPFLHKPWTVTELVTRVREVLDEAAE